MSFLDSKWNESAKTASGVTNGTGESAADSLMAARRRALQLQREEREARQRREGLLPSTQTNSTPGASSLFGGQNANKESSFPFDLFGDAGDRADNRSGGSKGMPHGVLPTASASHQGGPMGGVGSSQVPFGSAAPFSKLTHQEKGKERIEKELHHQATEEAEGKALTEGLEESVSALRQKVTAKKKLLQSLREKESALMEKVRTEKAHKKAEISQIEAQLRSMWEKVENEKRNAESKIRERRDEHEKSLLATRRQAEATVRQEYDPQITELQLKLDTLRKEEKRLKEVLLQEGDTKNLLDTAVASATNAIIERLHQLFSVSNEAETAKWNNEVEELVRHEVHSSFAVGVGTEAQSERESLEKYFNDMLELWKQAEEEERERILKMDDALLSDIQKMAQDNISRLQKEEIALDEVYIQSREAWASQHQKMLDVEQQAALQRRELDFNEQRVLLNQLHDERMKFVEERHAEEMKLEEMHHQKELKLLRELSQLEEELQDRQHQTLLSTQQEVQNATQSLDTILNVVEEIVKSMKEYQDEVDLARESLDDEQVKALEEREAVLESIKALLMNQHTVVESHHKQLSSTVVELSSLENVIQNHLREEETWLAQQEASCTASREEWQREYRTWKQIVEMERCRTEEEFSEALSALQNCITRLENEEREVKVEMDAVKHALLDIAEETEKEVRFLDTREKELQVRHENLKGVLEELRKQCSETAVQYQNVLDQRQQLASERTRVSKETAKIQQLENTLKLLQSAFPHAQKSASVSSARPLSHTDNTLASESKKYIHEGPLSSESIHDTQDRPVQKRETSSEKHSKAARHQLGHNRPRLPHQVLNELHQQLLQLGLLSHREESTGFIMECSPKRALQRSRPKSAAKKRSRHVDPQTTNSVKSRKQKSSYVPYSSPELQSSFAASFDDAHNSSMTNTFTNLLSISDHSRLSQ